jgi:hypothetical protein
LIDIVKIIGVVRMGMNLLFKDNSKDAEKRKMHKLIQKEAIHISFLAVRRKLNSKSVDKLEAMYHSYFVKYPDAVKETDAIRQINKLRMLCSK